MHNVDYVYFDCRSLFMKNIAAKEARASFGELMDTAQREPVAICKHGRSVAVIMSMAEYEKLKRDGLQTRVDTGFAQIDNDEISKSSAKDIFGAAKKLHEKIQTGSSS